MTRRDDRPHPELIVASAGTGKTHALTSLVWSACRGDSDASDETPSKPLRPEGLVGVTFTEKAAAELTDRIRRRLFLEGSADAAQRLPLAYLGTVHSVGLRVIREYAFEAGVSPDPRVLPDDGDRFARALLERAIPHERERKLAELGRRLRVRWDHRAKRSDWPKDVLEIVRRARANRIPHTALPEMAARAWSELRGHLPPVVTGRDLQAELLAEVARVLAIGRLASDSTQASEKAFLALGETAALIGVQGVWEHWNKLSRLTPGKASMPLIRSITTLADLHRSDPRFHHDLEEYIREAYAAAADAIASYTTWKGSQKAIDWIDMLDRALQVLDVAEVARDLGDRLDLVVVDELQDSGPLQVALFARLHEIVGRSTWVGDPKQCIFEWNGADPGLIDALVAQVPAHDTKRLSTNYRSRPSLVRLVSEVFAAAFASHAVPTEAVQVEPSERRVEVESLLAALPPLGIAWIDKGSPKVPRPSEATQLARVVVALLATPGDTPVLDRQSGEVRPLVAGDVAVLVRSNRRAQALAQALRERGIRVAVAIPGVLGTAEGRALQAALRLMVADDPLAEAELEMLDGCSGFARDGDTPEIARERWLAQGVREGHTPGRWSDALRGVRAEVLALSPAGVVDRVIEALDLTRWVQRWGAGAAERVANLDALRGLARTFESEAAGRAQGATLSGLMRHFAGLEDQGEQHVPQGDARLVTVATYHKAKGLEWPVVVLGDLGHDRPRTAFDVWAESMSEPSIVRPLEGRWVRYWPWPYGDMRSGRLKDEVMAGPVGRAVTERERRERVRLLYVGFTRARDHLVLAIPRDSRGQTAAKWLDILGSDDRAVFDYVAAAKGTMRVHGLTRFEVPCRMIIQSDVELAVSQDRSFVRCELPAGRPSRGLAPSKMDEGDARALDGASLSAGEVVWLADEAANPLWLGRSGNNADRAGLALHAFLAGDGMARPASARRDAARSWLDAYGITADAAEGVLCAADRFWAWVRARWGEVEVATEVPIHGRVVDPRVGSNGGLRVITGTIDLVLKTADGLVLIDHKSGGEDRGFRDEESLRRRAKAHAPQLAAYRLALELAGQRICGSWVHLVGAGAAIEMRPNQ